MKSLKITLISKNGFRKYMKSVGKLGGQNKVPRLSNNRKIADKLLLYMKKKGVAILGSTGSIGTQALEVVFEHKHLFDVRVLTANNNYLLLIEQAKTFNPSSVVITNENHYTIVNNTLSPLGIKFIQERSRYVMLFQKKV